MDIAFINVEPSDFHILSPYVKTVLLEGYSTKERELFSGSTGITYSIRWMDETTLVVNKYV